MKRRGFITAIAALYAWPIRAQDLLTSIRPQPRPADDTPSQDKSASLTTETEASIKAANLTGTLAYCVADQTSGQILAERNADAWVPPASVAKIMTALYAIEKLGPEHRFVTRVMRAGDLIDGTLSGDLILAGGGDPTFDTDKLGDLAAALAATGLRRITGRFIAYTGALPERFSISEDQPAHLGYNPAISGLMLNYNRVNFTWKHNKSGWLTQMNAEGARFTPQVHMAQIQVVDRDTPLFTYRAEPGKERWTVAATALAKDGSRWLPMRQPGPYVAEVFATLCAAHGIVLPNADITQSMPDGANELCRNQSEALPEVLRKMLKYSTNLTAEAVGLAASGAGDLAGSAQAMDDWAARRFGADVRMQDHSGLNPGSRVTARQMVQIVHGAQSIAKNIAFSGLLRQTEVKDANDQKIKDTPLKIQAKSGTLNFVSGLAGYVTGKAGHKATSTATAKSASAKSGTAKSGLCFAIFAADPDRRAAIPMQEREDPKGGSAWSKRARRLQGQLISQWSRAFL